MGVLLWGRDTRVQEHLGPGYTKVLKSFREPALWLPLFQARQGNGAPGAYQISDYQYYLILWHLWDSCVAQIPAGSGLSYIQDHTCTSGH